MEARLALLAEVDRLAVRGAGIEAAIEAVARMAAAGELPAWLQPMVKDANARGGGRCTLGASTLRRWRGQLARRGPGALAPEPARPEMRAPEPWLAALMRLRARPGKPSIARCYERLARERDDLPTLRSVQRTVSRLNAIDRNVGRMGPRELKKLRPYVTRSVDDLDPGAVYTADGHKADLVCASPETGRPFRPEIVTVLDVRTRMIVGWSAGIAEGAWLVADALRNASATCIAAIFYVDRGSGFVNRHLGDEAAGVLGRVGTSIEKALPYNSQARGVIERFHQSCWVAEARFLPGFVGGDMDPEARKRFDKRVEREIATAGTSRTLMSWADFLAWAQAQVEAYNTRRHSALPRIRDPKTGTVRHQSPAEAWAEHVAAGWRPVVPAAAELDDLFRPHVVRQVKRGRVQLESKTYYADELVGLDDETVLVGYDVRDPSRVWVRDAEHRLVAIAELDALKQPYFPRSAVERAMDKRKAAQLKRLERKAERLQPVPEAIEWSPPAAAIESGAAAVHQPVAGDVGSRAAPDPAHAAWVEAQLQEQAQRIEETPERRYVRWLALGERIERGGQATAAERAWWRTYPDTPEAISLAGLIREYGEELILGDPLRKTA